MHKTEVKKRTKKNVTYQPQNYKSFRIINKKKDPNKNIVFSVSVINEFKKIQHDVCDVHRDRKHPYTALLGKDKNGVIRGVVMVCKGTRNVGGCRYAPQLDTDILTKATLQLFKKDLEICGVIRAHGHYTDTTTCSLNRAVGSSFKRLFLHTNWCSVTLYEEGMYIEKFDHVKVYKNGRARLTPLGWDISL
jgi:hypothetical protein